MKYSLKNYGQSLAEAILENQGVQKDAVAKNFMRMLEKNGDEVHAGKIVREAERILRRVDRVRSVTIEAARPLSAGAKKSLAGFVKSGDVVDYRVNPELVAGVRIIIDDEREFDGSLRGKLDKLFGNVM